jgi:hypothetical protein
MQNPLETVLEKYFKNDEKIRYFHPCDAIANDQYIRWDYFKHQREQILISIGSGDGEVEVKIFGNAESLEQFIKLVIY